jgi:uncharacterized membrane protein required for colicin V production
MTWIDYSLLAILFLTTLFGLWSGLWWQIYRIMSLALAYVLAVRFHSIGDKLCEGVLNEKTAKVAGCVLVFVVALGATYLFGKFVKKVFGTRPGILGRVFGGILGLSKGALICSVIAFCLLEYNIAGQKEDLQISPITSTFASAGEIIAYIVPDRLRVGLETFVRNTSAKTKEVASEVPKLGEIVNKLKQHKNESTSQESGVGSRD